MSAPVPEPPAYAPVLTAFPSANRTEGAPSTATGSANRTTASTASPASQCPSGSLAIVTAVTPGASPNPSTAGVPSAAPAMAPPLSFSPEAATRTALNVPSASTARYANTSRSVPEPEA